MDFKLTKSRVLTKICQSLRSMKSTSFCKDPAMKALYTEDGQSILGDKLCSDVLFIRPFYEQLFEVIRRKFRVILLGNPGISKSV